MKGIEFYKKTSIFLGSKTTKIWRSKDSSLSGSEGYINIHHKSETLFINISTSEMSIEKAKEHSKLIAYSVLVLTEIIESNKCK